RAFSSSPPETISAPPPRLAIRASTPRLLLALRAYAKRCGAKRRASVMFPNASSIARPLYTNTGVPTCAAIDASFTDSQQSVPSKNRKAGGSTRLHSFLGSAATLKLATEYLDGFLDPGSSRSSNDITAFHRGLRIESLTSALFECVVS